MQTPSHVAISLFIWRKVPNWRCTLAVVFGAALPDLSMFLFYGFQKWIGSAEKDIWGQYYFLEPWLLFFDWFNSIPLFFAIAVYCFWRRFRIGYLIAASALVHLICDLPLHNDDAHRHFLPFTNWRYISPVSYWDPEHFGIIAMSVEFVVGLVASWYVAMGKFAKSMKTAGWVTLAIYVAATMLAAFIFAQYQAA